MGRRRLQMGYLTVRHGLQRVKGRGAVLSGVKSDASERRIPLLPVVAGALRRRGTSARLSSGLLANSFSMNWVSSKFGICKSLIA